MPEAHIIRSRATTLSNRGEITRKERRTIVDRLSEHGAWWLDDATLRNTILAGLPNRVVTKVLNGPTTVVRR